MFIYLSMEKEQKEQLVTNIKEWVKLDNEINQMKTEVNEKNKRKKLLSDNLMKVMKQNEIDCFDVNGGSLMYKQSKVKKPINAKMLLATLQKYYKSDATMADEITQFILDSREEQIKETLKRKVA
jgi:hypothetical protein